MSSSRVTTGMLPTSFVLILLADAFTLLFFNEAIKEVFPTPFHLQLIL